MELLYCGEYRALQNLYAFLMNINLGRSKKEQTIQTEITNRGQVLYVNKNTIRYVRKSLFTRRAQHVISA